MDSVFGDSRSGLATQPPPLAASRASPQDARARVPRHIGLIEPLIGLALAVYTAWLVLIAHPGRPLLWAWVVGAAVMALWSWRRPALHQATLLVRAVLFAVTGLAMVWLAGEAGAAGIAEFFFWVSLPALFYALLLRSSLAWGLLAANVVANAAVLVFAIPGPPGLAVAGCLGFLAVFGAAATRMGAVLRRTDELLEARRVDVATGMLNEYGFVDYGEELWADCRRTASPVTLVFLDLPDLPRLRQLYGSQTARLAADRVHHLMRALASGRNLVGRLSGSRFALLLPGVEHEDAMHFIGDRLGRPPQIELDDDDLELILLVNVHAAESRQQNVSFSRFFAAEHEMLDFYFSDRRPGGPQAAAEALAATARPPVERPEPISRWNHSDLKPPPSTVPFPPR